MNLHNEVQANMEHIQKVFLGVQDYMQKNRELEDTIAFLNSEPPEFRPVAYEAASMEIGLQDLGSGKQLTKWQNFYQRSAKAHTFHMDIGLGWAFAKLEISPIPFTNFLPRTRQRMVEDGLGYYYGLFKGRRTVKNQLVPAEIVGEDLYGFDQGLGRRLWYISKGEMSVLVELIQSFKIERQHNLWRGVGIACGYVGGNDQAQLERLLDAAGGFKDQLCNGINLAAISRTASNTITQALRLACEIICGKSLQDVVTREKELMQQLH